jgi:hypothetical protein
MLADRRVEFPSLRLAAKRAPPPQDAVLVELARALRPLQPALLRRVDVQLERIYSRDEHVLRFRSRGMSHAEACAKVALLETSALNLPPHIMRKSMTEFTLSEKATRELGAAGIFFVEDFVLKGNVELARLGMSRDAVGETEQRLLFHGIRTIDNPPERKTQ